MTECHPSGAARDVHRPCTQPREVPLNVKSKIVQKTPHNAARWGRVMLAEAVGTSHWNVRCTWADAGLKPNVFKKF